MTLHVDICSGRNRVIPLIRRSNTDSTPNKPVTLPRNQLLTRYAGTSPVHTVTIRGIVTSVYPPLQRLPLQAGYPWFESRLGKQFFFSETSIPAMGAIIIIIIGSTAFEWVLASSSKCRQRPLSWTSARQFLQPNSLASSSTPSVHLDIGRPRPR